MERLRYAALMHDIGKLVVPNQLLNKPGRLTESEFERVKRHESVSVELLHRIDFLAPVAGDTTTEAATAAVDGAGLIEPAIIHVADAFDAMTSTRSYRRALSQETAFAELRDGAGTQFNAACVDALIAAIERARRALRRRPRGRRARLGGRPARGRHRFGGSRPPDSRGAGGGVVRRWVRLLVLIAGGASVAIGIEIAHPGSPWAPLAVIGGAIAAGELIELRPPLRAALPISFAFMVVLARQGSVQDAALVLVVAELATFLVRSEPTSVEGRLALFGERLVEGMAAVLVYHGDGRPARRPPTGRRCCSRWRSRRWRRS